ncbi:MAG: NTP transferase domain-containing protein [Ilumatobacteraceae bacterium]|jgi:NDP-sugar pyrophosphorylase family protein|nr:NTP transferase domain-containing protein [Ilumatobacteraceae bacterium]
MSKMMITESVQAVDALILCGGLGSRLKSMFPDRPKGLASVAGRPVLDILVDDLLQQGFRRIILCVGHMKEQIIGYYEHRKDAQYIFSCENEPLGTGGAVAQALPLVSGESMLIMNGDSFCRVDYSGLVQFHQARKALASIVLVTADERRDCGVIVMGEEDRILSFSEKPSVQEPEGEFINAGVYLLQKKAFDKVPWKVPFSLEQQLFPSLVDSRQCYGIFVAGTVTDIGTPERYLSANAAVVQSHCAMNIDAGADKATRFLRYCFD